MKRALLLIAVLTLTVSQVSAHSGRTDKNGGHNCSAAAKKKGLCTGYHYHSGGGLYLDSTDELVSMDNGIQPTASEFSESHRVVDEHSDDHQHHDEKPEEKASTS